MKLSKYLNIGVAICISSFFLFISSSESYWIPFWKFFNIPNQIPPFSDLDSINRALLSLKQGFNPYLENPNDITGGKYIYPKIWLYIFDFLNLQNNLNLKIFCFLIITLYFFLILDLISKYNNKLFYIIGIVFIFSKINLLIIERFNIDIIIFVLSWLIIIYSKFYIKLFLYILSFSLKIYPLFSILIFLENKKKFFLTLTISLILLVIFSEDIIMIKSNMIPYAMMIAYGFETLARGIYHYSIHMNFIINDENYIIFKNIVILSGFLYSLLIFSINFKLGRKKIYSQLSFEENLFLLGGGIYVGTYLVATNIDFRLIFLFFTIPLLIQNNKNIFVYIYIIFYLICINSLFFEVGSRYTISYAIKSFIIHGMKFYIYSFIIYYISKLLNKIVEIKFR